MLSAYPACLFPEDIGYSVVFPDLSYLATCGDTLEDALAMGVDCLAGYLFAAKLDGESVPAPSAIADVDINAVANELECRTDGAFVNLITVDVDEYAKCHFEKSVKKTLTIPAWLNDAAVRQGVNFSQTLQQALKEQLHLAQ